MGLLSWVEKALHPPGITKPHRRAIFKTLADVSDAVIADIRKALRDWHPLTAADELLPIHGAARNIPRFPFDTDVIYRERLSAGAFALQGAGGKVGFELFLDSFVPKRWKVAEYPLASFRIGYSKIGGSVIGGDPRIIIFVKDLIPEESTHIYAFLDWFLGADIDITIINWEWVPYPPVDFATLRSNGGAIWLESQLADIGEISVELMPERAIVLGKFLIGAARLWGAADLVMVFVPEALIEKTALRLAAILKPTVESKIIIKE